MNFVTRFKNMILLTAAGLLVAIPPRLADAHNGGVVLQLQDNKIVVGHNDEVPGVPIDMTARAFTSLFRPELYGQDIPSFLTLFDAPAGTDRFPAGVNIYWDFLPMNANGVTSNLLYWNGQGTTVSSVNFGAVPQANVTMGLYNVTDGTTALVTGSPDMVAGDLLGYVDSPGSTLQMHRHNFFLLDDGDGGIPPTTVPEGVYLIAMQLRAEGYFTSEPFYIVPGTYELNSQSLEPLNAAFAWVRQNTDTLIRPGDYNFDGQVNAGDFTTWRSQYGSAGPFPINGDYADGTRDGTVNAADYVFWRKKLGAGSGSAAILSAPVPEPSVIILMAAVSVTLLVRRRCNSLVKRAHFV